MSRRQITHPVGFIVTDECIDSPYLLYVQPFTMSSLLEEAFGCYGLC
jgi:hypothetical protein